MNRLIWNALMIFSFVVNGHHPVLANDDGVDARTYTAPDSYRESDFPVFQRRLPDPPVEVLAKCVEKIWPRLEKLDLLREELEKSKQLGTDIFEKQIRRFETCAYGRVTRGGSYEKVEAFIYSGIDHLVKD